MSGIVVGFDGSDSSLRALDWAVKEAALQHAPLTVLTVHQVVASHWTGNPVVYAEDLPEQEKARQAAEEALGKAVSQLSTGKPASATVRALSGLAAGALIDASGDADLMVVGSRGAGGFASLLMGSVSSQVVHHAACPVVVVRSRR